MDRNRPKENGRMAGRSRAALLWGGGLFLAGLLALSLALEDRTLGLADPEYSGKLASLRARLADSPPDAPLVLLLGSSRVGAGLCPRALPPQYATAGPAPVVFNFALCRSNPVMEWLCLRRLLADGVRPRHVLVEITPLFFNACWLGRAGLEKDMDPGRLGAADVRLLAGYHSRPRALWRSWATTRLVPAYALRFLLLDRFARSFVPPSLYQELFGHEWHQVDGWGWLHLPPQLLAATPAARHVAVAQGKQNFAASLAAFVPQESSDRALRALVARCRRDGIAVSFLLMPDVLRDCYSAAARGAMDAYVRRLADDLRVAVFDTSAWAPEEDFNDASHLSPAGAVAFTERFAREILGPLLAGPPAHAGGAGLARARPTRLIPPMMKEGTLNRGRGAAPHVRVPRPIPPP